MNSEDYFNNIRKGLKVWDFILDLVLDPVLDLVLDPVLDLVLDPVLDLVLDPVSWVSLWKT
ncbi:hypothetical protein [Methanosarcina sp. 2.H.A.1B.4]|uniref:hypothetical protein n=1 Tax=Methanosarcina sp. 2.H.A.1B.4 TaxID=1483600 RepID=UPI000621D751|nr:hypothetical protein [Methanosarcina sp. 2.H.A.1B.4]KKG12918.1 hypothetical protein EO92_17275 [Methanosarcina sp. 2.H.A.1B.4]